ncbi:Hypothetical protein A7982_02207 [Minicystis rosea]|nr:Hypothetical protein A7982_02207 [Minicystis rosea]
MDGHALRFWVRRSGVRGCPDCDRLYLIITDADRKGAPVIINFADAFRAAEAPITPALVAETVRHCLRGGWAPGTGREPFASPEGFASIIARYQAQLS